MKTRHRKLTSALAALGLMAGANGTQAAEGGGSHYLPGSAGDVLLALSPKPGLQVANTVWYQTGSAERAVLSGQVDADIDLDIVLDIVAASYTFENPVLGGRYTVATAVPFGYGRLELELNRVRRSQSSFNVSDVLVVPLQINWDVGEFSFKFAEAIIAPTGAYDTSQAVNLGRNYWSFNTVGAATWKHASTGTELSIAPGIMVNTENSKTDYKTGTEFHADFTATQFLSKTFAIGLRGYYYHQLTGDSGSGAVLGDFKSKSVGVGPGFVWIPEFAKGKLTVLGKWMHDFDAKHRPESDYGSLSAAWKF